MAVLSDACIHTAMLHTYTNNVYKNKSRMTYICKKLSQMIIIWYLKVGSTNLRLARSRQFYTKLFPYTESLVIYIRRISNWSLYDEKANSSGQSNTTYNQNVQTLGTYETEILHVSAFASLEPHDINNAKFRVLNVQLTNKSDMKNGQQALTFQLLF